MRDPVDRFVSRYNFYRETFKKSRDKNILMQKKEMSQNINECVLNNHTECLYEGVLTRYEQLFRLDSQIPFFCGDSDLCLSLGHENAVEKAKENIEKSFLVVGTLEEIDKSIMVMQSIMPEYMTGLVTLNQQPHPHKHSMHGKVIPISSKAREVMKARLSREYELYEFVRNRLERQFRECNKIKNRAGKKYN
eukprot:GFUD01074283.1.p1 GENE.GFUD01074283.1~~GFUD01074283.1.p1  ORF type:complete len:192 (+),score=62.62 GFUD01074283.1:1-576(+)